ncbi:DUF4352 domain-containing protein [Streptococcus marmotae]|uniref:DUF4352 domain-containing protein n=1 Tax=Streptococcus marmotae TaxID=1825069 RepID=UPI0008321A9C|nr:DUF4352 domain-containing protein [Streptococcus marmotae]
MIPKEWISENGYVYYRKKPLYRQSLFWTTIAGALISCLLGLALVLALVAGRASSWTDTAPNGRDVSLESDYYREQAIGQKVELLNELMLTVDSMEIDTETTLVGMYHTHALVVNITIENPTKIAEYFEEHDAIVEGTGVKDNDAIGNQYWLDNRTYDVPLKKKIDPGEKVQFRLVYGVNPDTQYRFIYDGNVWSLTQGESL